MMTNNTVVSKKQVLSNESLTLWLGTHTPARICNGLPHERGAAVAQYQKAMGY